MTGVLANYVRRRIAMQTLGLLLFLTGLMQVLELMDITDDVLERNLGLRGLFHYAMLRLPSEIVLSLPLSILLGTMSAFYAMARSHEVVAIRSSGVSLRRMLVMLLPVPLVLALVQFFMSDRLVPVTEQSLKAWWDSTAPAEENPTPRWVRTADGPVSIDTASANGRQLKGVRIYLRDDDGMFQRRVLATSATWQNGGWELHEVTELAVFDGRIERNGAPDRPWKVNLRPDDVIRLDVMQPHLSSMMLADVIAGERVASQPHSYYQTVLFRAFTAPLGTFIMLLLAMPPARAVSRRGGGGGDLLVALGLGLAYLLCDGILSSLGTSGRIPALAAALFAPIIFAGIGMTQLTLADRS